MNTLLRISFFIFAVFASVFCAQKSIAQDRPSHSEQVEYLMSQYTHGVLVIHPDQIDKTKLWNELTNPMRKHVLQFIQQLIQLRIHPSDLETITVFLEGFSTTQAAKRFRGGPEEFDKPFFRMLISFKSESQGDRFFASHKKRSSEKKVRGVSVQISKPGKHYVLVRKRNGHDYIVATEWAFKQMHNTRCKHPELIAILKDVDPNLNYGLIMTGPLLQPLKEIAKWAAVDGNELVEVVGRSNAIKFTYEDNRERPLHVNIVAKQATGEESIDESLRAFLQSTLARLEAVDTSRLSPEALQALDFYRISLSHSNVATDQNGSRIEFAIPGSFRKVIVEKERKAQEQLDLDSLHLKRIAIACLNFQDTARRLPDNRPFETNRFPMSWRVKILPMLGLNELYEKYNPREPWDSEQNKKLLSQMPKFFGDDQSGHTKYLRIIGTRTHFGNGRQRRHSRNGPDMHSAMVARVGDDLAVPWTKPDDQAVVEGKRVYDQLGEINDKLLFVSMNGTVWYWDKRPDEELEEMLTGQPYPKPERPLSDEEQLKLDLENLSHLSIAQLNAQDSIGALLDNSPPPGKKFPKSWRVKAMDFEGYNIDYRDDEPWNSPHNKRLLDTMPEIFGKSENGMTQFVRPVGAGTSLGDGMQKIKTTDSNSKSVLVIKVGPDKAVPWTKPADLDLRVGGGWLDQLGNVGAKVPFSCMDGSRETWTVNKSDSAFERRLRGKK